MCYSAKPHCFLTEYKSLMFLYPACTSVLSVCTSPALELTLTAWSQDKLWLYCLYVTSAFFIMCPNHKHTGPEDRQLKHNTKNLTEHSMVILSLTSPSEWFMLWPDGFWRLGQSCQQLPGGRAPHSHHLLKADGQQRTIGWETATLGHQAVIGSDEITRPGRTFICCHVRVEGERETDTECWISEKYSLIWLKRNIQPALLWSQNGGGWHQHSDLSLTDFFPS